MRGRQAPWLRMYSRMAHAGMRAGARRRVGQSPSGGSSVARGHGLRCKLGRCAERHARRPDMTCPRCGRPADPSSETCPACHASLRASAAGHEQTDVGLRIPVFGAAASGAGPTTPLPGTPVSITSGPVTPGPMTPVPMSHGPTGHGPTTPVPTGSDPSHDLTQIDHGLASPPVRARSQRPGAVSRPASGGHASDLVGKSLGPRYHIIKLLGAGGMGAVYQAWDNELGVAVALKTVRKEVAADPETAQLLDRRFKQELLLARKVTHKNIVRVHDIGEVEGTKYITMPYLEGEDLATILKREGTLPVPRVS